MVPAAEHHLSRVQHVGIEVVALVEGHLTQIAAIASGLTGVVIFSALIAFLTTALDQTITHLKKGHTQVLESGHTLILGWGVRVLEILRELVEANDSEDDPVVVILADEDKEEMDDYLRSYHTDRRNTRVITRSGPTASLASLVLSSSSDAFVDVAAWATFDILLKSAELWVAATASDACDERKLVISSS